MWVVWPRSGQRRHRATRGLEGSGWVLRGPAAAWRYARHLRQANVHAQLSAEHALKRGRVKRKHRFAAKPILRGDSFVLQRSAQTRPLQLDIRQSIGS